MIFRIFLVLVFVLNFCNAAFQSSDEFSVKITEIAPHKIAEIDEWFEFSIQSKKAVDITNWKVSDGGSPKKFIDKKSSERI